MRSPADQHPSGSPRTRDQLINRPLSFEAQKTGTAGVQDILARWNGIIWVETSAGEDVVIAGTDARAPGISGGGEVD